ncbi:metallohydrolase [Bosea sp. (in: a-proteobacteria)]|uniref:metallohydrolase n=1 Tax=Bosea sp. (in: a-proteobacteria) TaxID=1871050 RepID=UPI0035653AB5
MPAKTQHFKVGNGDMTLIETASGRKILVDINICATDEPTDERPDVGEQLRDRLERDSEARLYVDAFLLTHPDQDHCRGLREHFHLGAPSDWSEDDDKIVIREMWSSPIVFRRASKNHKLCGDAEAWCSEARRRVGLFKLGAIITDGDRILVLGEDIDGKTDELTPILVKTDMVFRKICGVFDTTFQATLLAPMVATDEEEEELLSKNESSVVLNLWLASGGYLDAAKYLLAGDAEVAIWEKLWDRHQDKPGELEYDLLLSPHHCSWHSLSWDSWSEFGEDAQVSSKARLALSQTRAGATVLASSKPIEDDEDDPPCIRAKREYEGIVKKARGSFTCLADINGLDPYELEITAGGPRPVERKKASVFAAPYIAGGAGVASGSSTALGSQPFKHG